MSSYGGYAPNSADSYQSQKNKRAGPFPPFAVRFCPEYIKNPDCYCDGNCKKLHVCRRWIAGCCREEDCKYAHSLLIPQNVRVLSAAGVKISSYGCHDKVRRLLRCLFPQVCFSYNRGECKRNQCTYLHLCRDLIINGYCLQSSYKNCKLNHAVSDEQTRPILQKFGVTWGSQREIQALYLDILVADSPRFHQDCKCAKCIENKATGNASSTDSDNEEDAKDRSNVSYRDRNSAYEYDRGKIFLQGNPPAGYRSGPFAPSVKPAFYSTSDLDARFGTFYFAKIDDFSKLKLRDALLRGKATPWNMKDEVDLMTALVAFLIENTLVVPSELVARYFDIAATSVPIFVKSLVSADAFDAAFRSKLPTIFEWNGAQFVSLLNVARICIDQYAPDGCKNHESRCPFLHVCKAYVSGVCTDPACRFSHNLNNQPLFTRLGCDSYAIERRMALIRVSHPSVCAAYNYEPAGCTDAKCVNMHVCNNTIMGIPCSTLNCIRLKDHNPTSNGINVQNLLRYGLASTRREVVAQLVLPAVPPLPLPTPVNMAARPAQSSSASSVTTRSQSPAPPPRGQRRTPLPTEMNVPAGAKSYGNRIGSAAYNPPRQVVTELNKQAIPVAAASIIINQMTSDNSSAQHDQRYAGESMENNSLTVCESHLRGMCDSEEMHDGMIHFDHPFCWVYKQPRADDVVALIRRKTPDTRIFVAADHSRWIAFADKDNIIMERSFCSPDTRLLNRTVDLNEPYPFAGDSEIVFANNRGEAPFRMTTRIKQVVSTGVGQKTTGSSQGTVDEPTFRLSKQIEIEVRCFRTPSYVSVTPVCAYSTKWCWYFKHRDTESCEETWTKCDELVGKNAGEIEYAYITGSTSLVLPDKHFCRPGRAADAKKHYTFDFDTMLVSCDEVNLQTDLCSRPIDCFSETE